MTMVHLLQPQERSSGILGWKWKWGGALPLRSAGPSPVGPARGAMPPSVGVLVVTCLEGLAWL